MPPIKRNPYYNYQGLDDAFSNLASAFAPPTATELAGYAEANAKRQQTQALQNAQTVINDPNSTPEQRDRAGVLAHLFDPNQGWSALQMDDATKRYASDQTLAGTRYTADTKAQSDLDVARMNNTKDVTTSLLAALPQGSTRNVPPSIASAYGVPEYQSGNVAVQPGETVITPDGRTFEGQAKQLTGDEWKGQQSERLRQAGVLGDDDIVNMILGDKAPVQTVGADGKPRFMSPGQAARSGAEAYVYRAETKPDVANYVSPADESGKTSQGTAYFDGKEMIDTQTNKPIPAGSQLYKAQTSGSVSDAINAKTTEAQDKNAYAATMAEGPTKTVLSAFDNNRLPTGTDYQIYSALRSLPANVAPVLVSQMSPDGQAFYQGIRSALPYQLMSQSGQAVTEQEYERKLMELVPIPGEDPSVTSAKRAQFETYIRTARGIAGPAYDKVHIRGNIPKPGDASASTSVSAPPRAIEALRAQPSLAGDFDEKYGHGAAAAILGGH